jgi:hypothetical protein
MQGEGESEREGERIWPPAPGSVGPAASPTSANAMEGVGVNLVPKGGAPITTVLFSSEGAKNQRAPSEDYTFFHYC